MDKKQRIRNNAELGKSLAERHVDENGDFRMDNSGQVGAKRVVSLIVSLMVGALIAAFLLPIALEELAGSDLGANASDGATSLWNILDVIVVLAVFLFFIGIALSAAGKI